MSFDLRPRLGIMFREMLCLPITWLLCREIFVFNRMQTQASSFRGWLNSLVKLCVFRRKFKTYVIGHAVGHVLLNHQFSGYHLIARRICEDLGVAYAYWHPGFLPGTMSFNYKGQLAESELHQELARDGVNERPEWLSLGAKYIEEAKRGIYLRPGKSNQSNDEVLQFIREKKRSYQKVVLVIGSNDYRTGVMPDDYQNSDLHSRYYKTSDNLFEDVMSEAGSDCYVVYKPHPNVYPNRSGIDEVSVRTSFVFDVPLKDLLKEVDVSVSICSSGSYEARIAGVPAVVVGQLPGCNLGFFYVPTEDGCSLGDLISEALKDGVTADSQQCFMNFVGYSLSNYFFAYGKNSCNFAALNLEQATAQCFSRI